MQHRQLGLLAQAEQQRQHVLVGVLKHQRIGAVRVEGNGDGEALGNGLEIALRVLEMHVEVRLVPEHQVAAAIVVEVGLVDAAQIPGHVGGGDAVFGVGLARAQRGGCQVGVGRAELARRGEGAGFGLDGDPEAVGVGQQQIVASVAVEIAHDVELGDARFVAAVAGLDFHERALGAGCGVEPAHAPGFVGDEPVATGDPRAIDEERRLIQPRLERGLRVVVWREDHQMRLLAPFVPRHEGDVGPVRGIEKRAGHQRLPHGAGVELEALELGACAVGGLAGRQQRRNVEMGQPTPCGVLARCDALGFGLVAEAYSRSGHR